MKLVAIESPYAKSDVGTVLQHEHYARRCMADCIKRGEAPFVSHLLYTQVLNDLVPVERETGIEAGFVWGRLADFRAVYIDWGVSRGMARGIMEAKRIGQEYRFREIGR